MAPLALPRDDGRHRGAGAGARRRAVLRARASPRSRLPPRRRQRRRGRGDLPARRRAAAGDRAGGRALRAAVARRDRRAPGRRRSARWAPAPATRPRASRRCARRSTGATSCSATPRRRASRASRCSPAAPPCEAAETITGADLDTLDGLVAKSLLVRRQHARTPTRLGMLETIRAYATERFAAAADEDAVRERHYRYYLALAQRHGTERALWGAGRKEHLARLDAEIDNLHAALAWAVGQSRRRTGPRDVRGARPLLADARSLRRRSGLDRPGAAACRAPTPIPRCASARSASRPWCLWQLGRGAERPRGHGRRRRPSPARLAIRVILSQALQMRADSRVDCRAARRRRRARRRGAPLGDGRRRRLGDRDGLPREGDRCVQRSPSCASASTGPPRCWTRSATSTISRTCSPPPPTRRCAWAAIATPGTSSTARLPLARELDNPLHAG